MEPEESCAITFARWVDKNYFQGDKYNCFVRAEEDRGKEEYTIEELFKKFKEKL
jgi:hypothetical protein